MNANLFYQILTVLIIIILIPGLIIAAAYILVRLREKYSPRQFAQEYGAGGGFLTIGEYDIHYTDEGPRDGIPVVLVHGFGAWTFAWRLQRTALAQAGYRVIAYDELGYGASDRPAAPVYSTDFQSHILISVMDALAIRSAHLVGHSYGGRLAMLVAITAPERVLSFTGIDPEAFALGRPPAAAFLRLPIVGFALAFYFTSPFLIRPFMKTVSKSLDWFTTANEKGYQSPLFVRGTSMGQVWQARSLKDGPIAIPENLSRITQRTLLIWGSDDPVFPASEGQKMLEILPNARLRIISNAGHVPYEEFPDEVNGVLIDFLAGREIGA